MAIDPEIIPQTSTDGLNAKETPHDFTAYFVFAILTLAALILLKVFFQVSLMLIGIAYLIKLAKS